MNISIRPALREDVPALAAIAEGTDLFPADLLPGMVAGYLDGGGERWLVATADAEPVAFCYLAPERMTDRTWNMLALAVRPDRQGQGIGAAVVHAAESALRADGGRVLIVDTAGTEDFARTRAFYAALGYAQQGQLRDFWAHGIDKVIYVKPL